MNKKTLALLAIGGAIAGAFAYFGNRDSGTDLTGEVSAVAASSAPAASSPAPAPAVTPASASAASSSAAPGKCDYFWAAVDPIEQGYRSCVPKTFHARTVVVKCFQEWLNTQHGFAFDPTPANLEDLDNRLRVEWPQCAPDGDGQPPAEGTPCHNLTLMNLYAAERLLGYSKVAELKLDKWIHCIKTGEAPQALRERNAHRKCEEDSDCVQVLPKEAFHGLHYINKDSIAAYKAAQKDDYFLQKQRGICKYRDGALYGCGAFGYDESGVAYGPTYSHRANWGEGGVDINYCPESFVACWSGEGGEVGEGRLCQAPQAVSLWMPVWATKEINKQVAECALQAKSKATFAEQDQAFDACLAPHSNRLDKSCYQKHILSECIKEVRGTVPSTEKVTKEKIEERCAGHGDLNELFPELFEGSPAPAEPPADQEKESTESEGTGRA